MKSDLFYFDELFHNDIWYRILDTHYCVINGRPLLIIDKSTIHINVKHFNIQECNLIIDFLQNKKFEIEAYSFASVQIDAILELI